MKRYDPFFIADMGSLCQAQMEQADDGDWVAYELLADCEPYLKEGETPAECIERNRQDAQQMMSYLADERKKCEKLDFELGDKIGELGEVGEENERLQKQVAELERRLKQAENDHAELDIAYTERGERMKIMFNQVNTIHSKGWWHPTIQTWFDETGELL